MSDDFTKAIADSQQMPELPEEFANQVPDLLSGAQRNPLYETIPQDAQGKVPGAKQYNFTYRCARLIIGKVEVGFDKGTAEYEDQDDSDRLKEIMDMQLSGEAIISKKTETFLKDGTVVIWLEWMEPKKIPPKKDRNYLTTEELMSPESPEDSSSDDSEDTTAD